MSRARQLPRLSSTNAGKLAKELRIGDRIGTTTSGDPVHVKALHEVCQLTSGPHVHVVTSVEVRCFAFNWRV